MSKYKLVIFDMDGTLTQSEPVVARAFVDAVRQTMALSLDYDHLLATIHGRDASFWIEYVEARTTKPIPDDLTSVWIEAIQRLSSQLAPMPGAHAMLRELSGLLMCVASNADHQDIHFTLTSTGLLSYFGDRYFSGMDDVRNAKPAPDVFLLAAEKSGCRPEECIVLEDSPTGITAALAAGMNVVGYASGRASEDLESLTDLGVPVIQDLSEFPAYVLGA